MADRIEALLRLLQDEPDDTFCLYGLGQEYARAGDLERAIAYYDQTISVDPDYCYAYFHKARAQEHKGDPGGARCTLEAGLEHARSSGDDHAADEIQALLATLE